MKCIRLNADKKIKRVENTLARKLVNSGQATYCAKVEWKNEVRASKSVKTGGK